MAGRSLLIAGGGAASLLKPADKRSIAVEVAQEARVAAFADLGRDDGAVPRRWHAACTRRLAWSLSPTAAAGRAGNFRHVAA